MLLTLMSNLAMFGGAVPPSPPPPSLIGIDTDGAIVRLIKRKKGREPLEALREVVEEIQEIAPEPMAQRVEEILEEVMEAPEPYQPQMPEFSPDWARLLLDLQHVVEILDIYDRMLRDQDVAALWMLED
jgi:hypothetical protein